MPEASTTTGVWAAVLGLSLLSVLTTAGGVAVAVRFGQRASWIAVGVGFSAGIMVMVSLFDLLPESVNTRGWETALAWSGGGALALAALNFVVPHRHLGDSPALLEARRLRSAYMIAFGLILHDVPEGFALATSYTASPGLGVLVAIAIAVHNLPEEFAMAVPVVPLRRPRLLYLIACLSALAEPAGAAVGLFLVDVSPGLNAAFLALAAGAMLFVSAHELLPMARTYPSGGRGFLTGGAAAVVTFAALSAVIPR